MRTPRFFLGVIALALILPLLLACGGSDEPGGRASSGQTTAEPTTESAEPSPTPRVTTAAPIAQTSPETDREALIALYNATDGPNWKDNDDWLSDAPINEWHGVTTDSTGRVVVLDLSENRLSGGIPPELGNLGNLIHLALERNQLSGEIPPALGNLANLEHLVIDGNQLSGGIPPELGNLANLNWLVLDINRMSGGIPPEFGRLGNLTGLFLRSNQLSGEIPSALGNLANLEHLILDSNQLSGEIPPELGNLGNLEHLGLRSPVER